MDYSILMSVYHKEKPEYLKEAIESMLSQTVKSNDFVIVCDGPLTKELYDVIEFYEKDKSNYIRRIQLEKNMGLGKALNIGLENCKNELVARMDSDDISVNNRIELQLKEFEKNSELVLCGTNISEFYESIDNIIGSRNVPSEYVQIIEFSKKRNPFNHPSVMFKKNIVKEVGSYSEKYHLFEDYYLWIRILKNNSYVKNISKELVKMRTSPDLYARRGGVAYAKDMMRFHKWMLREKWIDKKHFIFCALPHAIVCVIPNCFEPIISQLLN